jgi:CRP-like cAMP-binding protein/uncharacterized protein (DUF2225 family)
MHSAPVRRPSPQSLTTGLPTLRRRSLVTGEVLLLEGDPPGAMYVLYSGSVRVYRRDPTAVNGVVDVAILRVGDVIGELAPILGQLRSASVQALEPTQVLEIPADQLLNVIQQYQPLLRVVALALRERSDTADDQIGELASRLGLAVPPEVVTIAANNMEPKRAYALAAPVHDPRVVYPKAVECPSCGTRFFALTVHVRKDLPAERESDFHGIYRTSYNPYDYEVWVCPNDLYAALPTEFQSLRAEKRQQIAQSVELVVGQWGGDVPDFNVDRTLELRERSLELALAQYRTRQAPHLRLAAITHRLAWCARERLAVEAENKLLVDALDYYTSGYSDGDMDGAKEELRVQYLCGELSLRLGAVDDAVVWFSQALRHPDVKEHPSWERMLRQQWGVARENSVTETATS